MTRDERNAKERARWQRRVANGLLDRDFERARSKRNYRKAFAKDPDKFRRRARAYKQERLDFVRACKNQPCADCGVIYPPHVMDFDHVRGTKLGTISKGRILLSSMDALMAEIDKCDVVCSNCHRDRTYQRLVNRNDD